MASIPQPVEWEIDDVRAGPAGVAVFQLHRGDLGDSFRNRIVYHALDDAVEPIVLAETDGANESQVNVRGLDAAYALVETSVGIPPSWSLELVRLVDGHRSHVASSDDHHSAEPPLGPAVLNHDRMAWTQRDVRGLICLWTTPIATIEPRRVVCEDDLDGRLPARPSIGPGDTVLFVAGDDSRADGQPGFRDNTGWEVTITSEEPRPTEVVSREGTLAIHRVGDALLTYWRTPDPQPASQAEQNGVFVYTAAGEERMDPSRSVEPCASGRWSIWGAGSNDIRGLDPASGDTMLIAHDDRIALVACSDHYIAAKSLADKAVVVYATPS